MTATLTVLFSAHLAGNLLAERYLSFGKGRSFLNPLSRAIAVVALSATLAGASDPRFLATLLATHVALAPVKVLNPPRSLPVLALNGLIRWTAIVALSASFEDAFANGWWASLLTQELQQRYLATLCVISGVVLSLPVGGAMIALSVKQFTPQLGAFALQGLTHGGTYIGWLERFLIGLLVFIHQPAGVGFLITAKSIFRFAEIKDSRQRRLAEYIIIGTFMSFAWGLLVAMVTLAAVEHWLPPSVPMR